MHAEQMKGKMPKITSLWAGSSENISLASVALQALFIAAQTFPGKSFLGADVVFCHGPLLQKFYCFWRGDFKIRSKPFDYVTTGCIAGNTGKMLVSKVTISTLNMVCGIHHNGIFLNSTLPFSVLPSRLCGLSPGRIEAVKKGVSVTIFPGVFWPGATSLNCHTEESLGSWEHVGDGDLHRPYLQSPSLLSDRVRVCHRIRKITSLKSSFIFPVLK